MKLETFFEKFDQFADAPGAPGAVAKMQEFVLPLAVTGRRIPLDPLNNCDAEILPRAVAKLASTALSVAQR